MSISKTANSEALSWYTTEHRLQIEHLLHPNQPLVNRLTDGRDVIQGLTQTPKSLPPKYLYDEKGSQLFEQICELPEYYLTRTETAILQNYAAEIAQLTGAVEIVELGSGSSTKTRILLDAYDQLDSQFCYVPIDVSASILEMSAKQLLADYPSLQVHGLVGTYELGLAQLPPPELEGGRMICFIGSTLGNLTPQECDEFFSQITAALQLGEYFLLGVDLQKPIHLLEAAYNDSQGVTAEFNLNMLEHLNWRFEGNFDITQFEHLAFYNQTQSQIEIYVRSLQAQTVQLNALNLTIELQKGETILTEISRKFNLEEIQEELRLQGLMPLQVWTDPQQWFGLILCQLKPFQLSSVTD